MRLVFLVATVVSALVMTGCATSRVSTIPIGSKPDHVVRAIALDPAGGLLADAVGVELANKGFTVIDSASTSRLMVRLNLNEVEIAKPEGLGRLKTEGIDAYLIVRAGGGYDLQPQSASARMNSTHSGKIIAGVTWQNGWGGQAGSIADRTMRKGLNEASAEIANALVVNLK